MSRSEERLQLALNNVHAPKQVVRKDGTSHHKGMACFKAIDPSEDVDTICAEDGEHHHVELQWEREGKGGQAVGMQDEET